jgi:hypothetical protein
MTEELKQEKGKYIYLYSNFSSKLERDIITMIVELDPTFYNKLKPHDLNYYYKHKRINASAIKIILDLKNKIITLKEPNHDLFPLVSFGFTNTPTLIDDIKLHWLSQHVIDSDAWYINTSFGVETVIIDDLKLEHHMKIVEQNKKQIYIKKTMNKLNELLNDNENIYVLTDIRALISPLLQINNDVIDDPKYIDLFLDKFEESSNICDILPGSGTDYLQAEERFNINKYRK